MIIGAVSAAMRQGPCSIQGMEPPATVISIYEVVYYRAGEKCDGAILGAEKRPVCDVTFDFRKRNTSSCIPQALHKVVRGFIYGYVLWMNSGTALSPTSPLTLEGLAFNSISLPCLKLVHSKLIFVVIGFQGYTHSVFNIIVYDKIQFLIGKTVMFSKNTVDFIDVFFGLL